MRVLIVVIMTIPGILPSYSYHRYQLDISALSSLLTTDFAKEMRFDGAATSRNQNPVSKAIMIGQCKETEIISGKFSLEPRLNFK